MRLNKNAIAEAGRWNASHSIGAPVRFWPGVKDGPGREARTRSEADVIGGTAVVWVEGYAGCVALSHVEAIKLCECTSRCPCPESLHDTEEHASANCGLCSGSGLANQGGGQVKVVMKLVELVLGVPSEHAGRYLVEYDPTTQHDSGFVHLVTSADPREAKVYDSLAALQRDWAWSIGTRPDGLPDRPLTAFTIEVVSLGDALTRKVGT